MRLTVENINRALNYHNTLKERELDLRGHSIPTLENLGAAREPECIDFTDNSIVTLENFPLNVRLHTLLCARNRIRIIAPNLAKSLPNLTTISLAQNSISELADLAPLRDFKRLTHVSLIENPVVGKENYRYWLLHLAPQIRFLDFQKVKDAERAKAKELFGTVTEPNEAAQAILKSRSNVNSAFTPVVNGSSKQSQIKLTDAERKKIELMIRKAKSLAEVSRLEKDLSEGRMPAGMSYDAMDTT